MKEDWEYKSLGDVCEILDSRRKPITKNKRESGTIPYYGATGILDYVKDYIFDEKLVLLGEDGAKWGAGEKSAYIIEGKSWVNNHAHALRPKRDLLVDEILVYYLNFSNLLPYITGVTVPKLNQEKMRSIEIPIGPVKEQQSIVDYLDSAFAKIDAMKANAEKALNEAKALFQASLKEMLEPKEDWKYKKLGEVCEILDSRRKPITKNKREPGTIPYYGATGILDYVKDYIFDEKLVLLGEDGAKWGAGENSAYIIEGKTWVNNHAHALRPKRELLVDELLVYYLNFANLQPFITGVTVPKLNQEKMRSIEIPVPPISDQQSIVETLDSLKSKVDKLQENYDKISQECDALKQAILRQVFE